MRAQVSTSRRTARVSGRCSSPGWSWAVAGEAVDAAASDAPPERLGEYRLIRFLGRGGMGSVWLARSAVLEREVALKLLNPSNAPDDLLRFIGEAKAIARLHHPNIVRVHELSSDQGRWFLALELVRGGSLADRIEEVGPLDPREAVNLALRLARALHYAHGRGVLHRDVKPSNVLLAVGGEPLLNDFGLAKDLRSKGPSATLSGDVLGTPAYMPPEQARAEKLDARCDVYALGATLFEMLIGRAPFLGRGADVLASVLREPPPPLRALRPELDPALEALVLSCLAKDPAERPESAGALASQLVRWLAGKAPAPRPRRQAPARLRRRLISLAAASVCALVGGVGAAGLIAEEELAGRVGLGPAAGQEAAVRPGIEAQEQAAKRRPVAKKPGARKPGAKGAGAEEELGQDGPGRRVESVVVPQRGQDERNGARAAGQRRRAGRGPAGLAEPDAAREGSAPARREAASGGAGPRFAMIRLPEELETDTADSEGTEPVSDPSDPESTDPVESGGDSLGSALPADEEPAASAPVSDPGPEASAPEEGSTPDAPPGSSPNEGQHEDEGEHEDDEGEHDDDEQEDEDEGEHEDGDYQQAIAPSPDPQGYAWDSYYQPNTAAQGQVTGFAALSPSTLLVEQVPARIDAVVQGQGAPQAQAEAVFPARLSSTAAASGVAVAALSDPTVDGAGAVWERAADGAWAPALQPPRRHTIVVSLGDLVHAFSGDDQGGPILVHVRDPASGAWTRATALGPGVPTRAVVYGGELWVAVRPAGTGRRAQVIRGQGSAWVDVREPFDGAEPRAGERQEVTAFLVVGRFLFAALAQFDMTGNPIQGEVMALGKERLKRVAELRGDAPMALAYQGGTVHVGTRRGRLLTLNKAGKKVSAEEPSGLPGNRGILALHTPDARTLLVGVEGPLGAEVLRRRARSR